MEKEESSSFLKKRTKKLLSVKEDFLSDRLIAGMEMAGGWGWIMAVVAFAAAGVPGVTVAMGQESPADLSGSAVVLAAALDLNAGDFLRPDYIEARTVPAADAPFGALPDTLGTRRLLFGVLLRHGIRRHDIIRLSNIIDPGDRDFLAAALSRGYCAMVVGADTESVVSDRLWPGDRLELHEDGPSVLRACACLH